MHLKNVPMCSEGFILANQNDRKLGAENRKLEGISYFVWKLEGSYSISHLYFDDYNYGKTK